MANHYIYASGRHFYPSHLMYAFYHYMHSLGIEPMTLAFPAPCSTGWATGINGAFFSCTEMTAQSYLATLQQSKHCWRRLVTQQEMGVTHLTLPPCKTLPAFCGRVCSHADSSSTMLSCMPSLRLQGNGVCVSARRGTWGALGISWLHYVTSLC